MWYLFVVTRYMLLVAQVGYITRRWQLEMTVHPNRYTAHHYRWQKNDVIH